MGCSFVSYGLEVCVIQVLDSAKWPMIVIGSSCLQRTDRPGILSSTLSLAKRLTSRSSLDSNCRVFNVLQWVRHSRDDECLLGFSKTASYLLPVSFVTSALHMFSTRRCFPCISPQKRYENCPVLFGLLTVYGTCNKLFMRM